MWDPEAEIEYIRQRWKNFKAKLNSTQTAIIINKEFYVHWMDTILNREIHLRDPFGKHFIQLNYNGDRKFDFQILNSDMVEIQYPPLPIQPPPAIVPPPPQFDQNGHPHVDIVEWDVVASESFASGKSPLYFPAHVVRMIIGQHQQWLDLISDAGVRVQAKILKKNERYRNERYLGLGWYQFCRDLHFQEGDVVHLRFNGNPNELSVSVN
ncbi:DNA-binding barrel domain superfamily [Sesbania bispinosa]|nr:DNA-binding barrel domain superfamily [Sesbania bispinosa]